MTDLYVMINGVRTLLEGDAAKEKQADIDANIALRSEQNLEELRGMRNSKLNESDWIIVKSLEANESVPDSWKTYRQSLRDITKTSKTLDSVQGNWPTKPE